MPSLVCAWALGRPCPLPSSSPRSYPWFQILPLLWVLSSLPILFLCSFCLAAPRHTRQQWTWVYASSSSLLPPIFLAWQLGPASMIATSFSRAAWLTSPWALSLLQTLSSPWAHPLGFHSWARICCKLGYWHLICWTPMVDSFLAQWSTFFRFG